MKKILFRGKRVDNGDWVYGDLVNDWTKQNTKPDKAIYNNIGKHLVIPETIGQYTGLTDYHGTKIFEGDIIRYADIDEYRMYLEALESPQDYEEFVFDIWTIDEVVYDLEVGYPAFDLNKHDWEVNGLSNLNESGQFFYEIIGNIHDNPELLGGANG